MKKKRGRKKGTKNKDKQLLSLKDLPKDKAKLIKQIWKLEPSYKTLGINLSKYTTEQLQYHVDKILKREVLNDLR